jgi:WD40 repeat protein
MCCLLSEGSILATGSRDYSVNFWDVSTAQKLASNQTTLNMVTGLKHLDSNLFVQTSEDLKMRIWDANAQEVQSFALTQYFPVRNPTNSLDIFNKQFKFVE